MQQIEQGNLKKGLSNRHIQLIALGGSIGTGLFLGIAQTIKLAVIPGDGIGKEVVPEGLKVMRAALAGTNSDVVVETTELDLGADRWHRADRDHAADFAVRSTEQLGREEAARAEEAGSIL